MDQKFQQGLKKAFRRFLKTRRATNRAKEPSKEKLSDVAAGPTTGKTPKLKQKPAKKEVPKMKRLEEEEVEEFEAIPGANPAVCIGKRKAKMKWKKDETAAANDDDSARKDKVEQVAYDDVTNSEQREPPPPPPGAGQPGPSQQPQPDVVAQIRQELNDGRAACQKQMAQSRAEQEEMQELLKALKASSSTVAAPPKVKQQSSEPVKTRKKERKKNSTVSLEEGLDPETKAIAVRVLEILKRNQLLEKALSTKENLILSQYFKSPAAAGEAPEEVLKLLDKAMTIGLEKLILHPHELDDPVDNQIRTLLMNQDIAKTILLEVMLAEAHFLPVSWNGGKTQQQQQKSTNPEPVLQSVSMAPKK